MTCLSVYDDLCVSVCVCVQTVLTSDLDFVVSVEEVKMHLSNQLAARKDMTEQLIVKKRMVTYHISLCVLCLIAHCIVSKHCIANVYCLLPFLNCNKNHSSPPNQLDTAIPGFFRKHSMCLTLRYTNRHGLSVCEYCAVCSVYLCCTEH